LIEALDDHMMVYLEQRRRRLAEANGEDPTQLVPYTEEERIRESSRRRAMIEYVMLEGETSSIKCAHQLGKLCENRHMLVNLIPYNQTDVEDELRCPSFEHMQHFRDIVASYGTFCTIRRTMGADIASACGQLVQKKDLEEKEKRSIDIEDVVADQTASTNERHGATILDPSVTGRHINPSKDKSWLDSMSMDDLEHWLGVLGVAATVSATCFVVSAAIYLKKKS
jgi:sorting nexin-8